MSTAVRSRVFKISAAAVTAAIAIGLCLFSQDDVSASIKERRVERLNAQIENVYTDECQQMMDTEIADERDAKERTVDSIYTKVNPYGTNTTSMYVYFTTDQASTVSYTVSAEGYPDYTANAITSDEAAPHTVRPPPATPTVPAMSAVPARRVRRPRYRAMTSPPPSTSFWCWD